MGKYCGYKLKALAARKKTIVATWTKVLILPGTEGRKRLKPVTMLMTSAPSTIKTSRLIVTAVSQNGMGGVSVKLPNDKTTKAVTRSNLSAIGSRIAPSCVL